MQNLDERLVWGGGAPGGVGSAGAVYGWLVAVAVAGACTWLLLAFLIRSL